MTALKPVLEAVGYTNDDKQVGLVRLLHFTGCFDSVPNNNKYKSVVLLDDNQARDMLNDDSLFSTYSSAHEWLKASTQEKFIARDEKGKAKDYIYTDDKRFPPEYREAVTEILMTLGLVNEVRPGNQEYDYGVVLGAREATVTKRIDHMAELYKNDGIRFNKVALLGSNRPLLAEQERASAVHIIAADLPSSSDGDKKNNLAKVNRAFDEVEDDSNFTAQMIQDTTKRNKAKAEAIIEKLDITYDQWPTEIQMIQHVYEQNKERLSEPSAPLGVISIEAPMYRRNPKDKSVPARVLKNTTESMGWLVADKLRRANTADTVKLFLEHPDVQNGGSVLAVSSQPYVVHQDAQLRSLLPEGLFTLDTVSRGVQDKESLKLQDALGSIAKAIYAGYPRAHKKVLSLDDVEKGEQSLVDELVTVPAKLLQEIKAKAAKAGKSLAQTIVTVSEELTETVNAYRKASNDENDKENEGLKEKLKNSTKELKASLGNLTNSLTNVGAILDRLNNDKRNQVEIVSEEAKEKQKADALSQGMQSKLISIGGDRSVEMASNKRSRDESEEQQENAIADNVVRRRARYSEPSRSA